MNKNTDNFNVKIELNIHMKMVDYLKKALIYGHTSRISN